MGRHARDEMLVKVTFEDEEGDEQAVDLPGAYSVCGRCEGKGSHVNPDVECDGGGITGGEMAEILHDDPEFLEKYMGGDYDMTCRDCKGLRVVLEVDEEAVERSGNELWKKALAAHHAALKADATSEAERAYERRIGY